MINIDLENVQEAGDYKSLAPGGYICKITTVENVKEKEYLRIEYDIADGEFVGYFNDLYENKGFWGGSFIRSYKKAALPFFKAFITSLEESNKGYKWDKDETKVKYLDVGLVLAEEEYKTNDGTIKTRLYVDRTRSINAIKSLDFILPPKKMLSGNIASPTLDIAKDEDIPFI